METEKSAYFVSSYYRVKLKILKTFLSPSVFFWDSTYAVVTVIWADICVWKPQVLLGSVSSLKTLLPKLSSFLGKVEWELRLLGCHAAKLLEPVVCSVWYSGRRSCVVGRGLLLNINPTMDQGNHPNNAVSSISTPLWNISVPKGKCVRGVFFWFWLDGELCCNSIFFLTYMSYSPEC